MEPNTGRRPGPAHVVLTCTIGAFLCAVAAAVPLLHATHHWAVCGSGIDAAEVAVLAWPTLHLVDCVLAALVLTAVRRIAGWAGGVVAAALVVTVWTVVAVDLSLRIVNPVVFPPFDLDGYATSDAEIARCVAQVPGAWGGPTS